MNDVLYIRRDVCPVCDSNLIETDENIYCTNQECEFKITKSQWKQTLAIANFAFMIMRLAKSGRVNEAVKKLKLALMKLRGDK